MDASQKRWDSIYYLHTLYRAIILGKYVGLSPSDMEAGFKHALLQVQTRNLDRVPDLPADLVSSYTILWGPTVNQPKTTVEEDFHG